MSHLQIDKCEVLKYPYFNLDSKYFQSVELKDQIIEIFKDNWFYTEFEQIEVKEINDLYNINNIIKKLDKKLINRLLHYPLKRCGNGEVLLYLFVKNSYLSSENIGGRDIIINNEHYEIKNIQINKKYNSDNMYFNNFKLGSTFCIREIINLIEEFFGNIPKGSELANERLKSDSLFLIIEELYREFVYKEYFSKHKIIFLDKYSEVKYCGYVKRENIFIDTITEGTIKPMILINK